MKLLITNDDGYQHQAHIFLKDMLQNMGHEVWSIAPQENQSGAAMKLTMGKSLEFLELDSHSWACSGTPVDCVLFALHGFLSFRPDAVISGINAGANLSDDVWYSGTVAAAREASKWGLPALALSYSAAPPYEKKDFAIFAALLKQHLTDLLQACDLTDKATEKNFVGFLNINIPPHCDGEIIFAERFVPRPYKNVLQKTDANKYMLRSTVDKQPNLPACVDTAIDANSKISISLGSFQTLQPLPCQLASQIEKQRADGTSEPLYLHASEPARQAIFRIMKIGI